ncbi:MAG TPA: DNA repair protein RecO [Longimicrobiales bacterium]|nr:DNA repair protein RecO [Longimicrobiales bacterium]
MNQSGPIRTRAVLLRTHDYSETSRIHRYFTVDQGMVSVMARGIRKRSAKGGASAGVFDEVDLEVHMRPGRDLQTLRDVTLIRSRPGLGRTPIAFGAAAVLGEIVLRHHGEEEAHLVYEGLVDALDQLADTPADLVPGVLLARGWRLVGQLGFHPQLTHCILCGRALDTDEMARMDFEAGGVRCLRPACGERFAGPRVGPGARAQLTTLLGGRIPENLGHIRAHLRLFGDFTTVHVVGGRPLDAFRVFAALMPATRSRA